MNSFVAWVGVIVCVGIGVAAILSLGAFITMWAWNLVMPYLFHLPVINFWIAMAINILLAAIKPSVKLVREK